MASSDIQPLLDSQPPNLPFNVARVTADGRPTSHLLDWEEFTKNWFRSNIVKTDQRIETVKAVADGASAAVTTEEEARAAADGALALRIDTVEAYAGDATANGQIYFAAMAAPAGAVAAYGIFLSAGNAYTGMRIIAKSDGTAAIMFDANYFALNDSGTLKNVFTYMSGKFHFNVPVSVQNDDIGNEAVTRAWTASGGTNTGVNVNFRGTGFLEIYAQFMGDGSGYPAVDQFVLRVRDATAGTSLGDTPINQAQNGTGTSAVSRYGATSIVYIVVPPTGPRTYTVELVKTLTATSLSLSGVLIVVKEYSK